MKVAVQHDDDDEPVQLYDVLAAMASSLVETDAHFNVPSVPDRPVNLVLGGKPPREVFYNKSVTFMTSVPKSTTAKRCSCKYVCTGSLATIKCYNCATFDPYGLGYFCELCFKARHPWHRVAHIFADIDNDENIEYTMKVAHRRAEAVRYEKEGTQILDKVKAEKRRLKANIKVDKSEETIRLAGRKTVDLIGKMRELKSQLRDSIEDLRFEYPEPSAEQVQMAASIIKRCLLGFKIRKLVSLMYVERVVRVFDKRTSRDFFYNKITGATSWTPPRFILRKHADMIAYLEEDKPPPIMWFLKINCKRRRTGHLKTQREALPVLQNFCRCILARKICVAMAKQVYRRIYDEDYGTYFYSNLITHASTWTKPSILLMWEPPVMKLTESSLTGKKVNKRDPRINRLEYRGT